MMSLAIPSYLAADRCFVNGGRFPRQSAHRWGSPAPSKKRPQQRQNGESVPSSFSRQPRQTTLSPGFSSRASQPWQEEGKRRSSPSFPAQESRRARSEVKPFLLLFSADSQYSKASRAARPAAFFR